MKNNTLLQTDDKNAKMLAERKPQRPREKPTEPNKHISERVPQKEKEKKNFPVPSIPERKPQRQREKPTKLRP